MNSRIKAPLAFAGLFLLLPGCSLFTEVKEPPYSVQSQAAGFELRQYPSYLVAQVSVQADFEEAGNRAFRLLFRYIDGNNRKEAKIAMTAPVNQTSESEAKAEEGEKIEMTSPVNQTQTGKDTYTVQFVMPESYTMSTLPEPLDDRVILKEEPARLMAVRQYSGSWSRESYEENLAALKESLAEAGLETKGSPLWSRYDPPRTLWFLRRNEIMLEVVEKPNRP